METGVTLVLANTYEAGRAPDEQGSCTSAGSHMLAGLVQEISVREKVDGRGNAGYTLRSSSFPPQDLW